LVGFHHKIRGVGDKRRLERFALRIPARLSVRGHRGADKSLEATTRDISAEGAYLYVCEHTLVAGATVEVEFALTFEGLRQLMEASEQVTARVQGTVLREEPDGVVVEFTQPFRFFPGPGGSRPMSPYLRPA
jgi:hypothetical protein